MNDYHHFNNPRLLKDRFEKLNKIAAAVIVTDRRTTDYDGAVQKLGMLARLLGLKLHDLVEKVRQISYETGISFVDAVDEVKEKYLG